MKSAVSPKVGVAIVVVVVLLIIGVAWKMFAPTHVSKADSDAYLAAHPEAKAASENMSKMAAHPTPPPGVNTRGR